MRPDEKKKTYNGFLSKTEGKYPSFDEYIPFHKLKIDALLALQVVLFKTTKMGIVIIKDGIETTGKKTSQFRKWFMEQCKIKKIMKIPTGSFSCTATKTICIYFTKGDKTDNIQFIDLSEDGTEMKEICNVSVEQMAEDNYSWNPSNYIVDSEMQNLVEKSSCKWCKLKDVCGIGNGKSITKKNLVPEGNIPVVGGGIKLVGYHNVSNLEKDSITISKDGANAGYVAFQVKAIFATGHCLYIKDINKEKIRKKYLYFILKKFEYKIYELQKGAAQPGVDRKDILKIAIPLPTLEIQDKILEQLDQLENHIKIQKQEIENAEKYKQMYFNNQIKLNTKEDNIKTIKNMCSFKNGVGIKKKDCVDGDYNLIGGGKKPIRKHNKFNTEANSIICSKSGSAGYISRYSSQVWANSDCFKIHSKDKQVLNENYLYYFLKLYHQENIYSRQTGAAQPHVYEKDLYNLSISVLDMEKQVEISQHLDKWQQKIENINIEISEIETLKNNVIEQYIL